MAAEVPPEIDDVVLDEEFLFGCLSGSLRILAGLRAVLLRSARQTPVHADA